MDKCYDSISYLLICLNFIMYIVLQSHLFYRILYPPLSTLLPSMFVISCVCQLFNKECMMTVDHPSSITCRYLPGYYTSAKLYRLVTEAHRCK